MAELWVLVVSPSAVAERAAVEVQLVAALAELAAALAELRAALSGPVGPARELEVPAESAA